MLHKIKEIKKIKKTITTGYVWFLVLYPYHKTSDKLRCF